MSQVERREWMARKGDGIGEWLLGGIHPEESFCEVCDWVWRGISQSYVWRMRTGIDHRGEREREKEDTTQKCLALNHPMLFVFYPFSPMKHPLSPPPPPLGWRFVLVFYCIVYLGDK